MTVATKFYIPFIPVIKPALTNTFQPVLGSVITEILVWWLVFWLPDVFGYSWALPQILRESGRFPR